VFFGGNGGKVRGALALGPGDKLFDLPLINLPSNYGLRTEPRKDFRSLDLFLLAWFRYPYPYPYPADALSVIARCPERLPGQNKTGLEEQEVLARVCS